MLVSESGYSSTVLDAVGGAERAELIGYDGWWAGETQYDPFLACAVAASRTQTLQIGTSVAVAFARNPMTVAVQANDLQLMSQGRFTLGLGSQVKAHIERRYSMPWSRPAARMREFVLAIRSIWAASAHDEALAFKGEFYEHTLTSPMFKPGPNPFGNPKILIAVVGPLMTEVAGEVCDGVLCHGFSTERYLREVTIPALERGARKAGRSIADLDINVPVFVVANESADERAQASTFVKHQLAFYGSTPAYRNVLALHGWEDLQPRLNEAVRLGQWDQLETLIDDELLNTFAVVGTPSEAAAELQRRYGDVASGLMPITAAVGDDQSVKAALCKAIHALPPRR